MASWHHPDDWTDASFLAAVCVCIALLWLGIGAICDGSAWAWLMSVRIPGGW